MSDRTPFPMIQNGPAPLRDWDDDDRVMVMGPDKGVGLVPTGGLNLEAGSRGPGSVARSVAAELADLGVPVTRLGATSEDADSAAGFRAVDAALADSAPGIVHAGTWTFATPFSGTAADYIPLRSSLRGSGADLTIFDITHSTSYRSFRIGPGSGPTYGRAQSRSEPSPHSLVRAINDITAGANRITYTTASELVDDVASGYVAKGRIFHVAGGKNVQDADDSLWFYDMLHRVVDYDTANGHVYLERAIPFPISSQGWDGAGAGKNLAEVYANSTSYTAGDYVWDDVATSTLYRARTSGTSNSANRSTDTGVTWDQVTTSLGALKAGEPDHRPVFQAAYTQIKDLVFEGLTFRWSGSIGGFAIEISGGYNITFRNCDFRNCTLYVVEGSSVTLIDCNLSRESIDGTNSTRNVINACNAFIRCVRCTMVGGNSSSVSAGNRLIKLESWAMLELIDCDLAFINRSASQAFGILIDRGHLKVRGGSIRNCNEPVRMNVRGYYEEEMTTNGHPLPSWADIKNCELHISSRAFRVGDGGTDRLPTWYGATNHYVVWNPYSSGGHVQSDDFQFRPQRLVPISFSFTPSTNQSSTVIEIPDAALMAAGIFNSQAQSMVILGASVLWNTPGSNDLDIRFIYKQVGQSATRAVFSTTGANNRIVVNNTTAYGFRAASDGTGYRLGQTGVDYPRITYTSGASAGGTCYVTIWALL